MANLKTVPRQLQTTWVIQSMYWLTAFPLRGFSALFDLAQVISLLFVWVQTILFGRTPRDIREVRFDFLPSSSSDTAALWRLIDC